MTLGFFSCSPENIPLQDCLTRKACLYIHHKTFGKKMYLYTNDSVVPKLKAQYSGGLGFIYSYFSKLKMSSATISCYLMPNLVIFRTRTYYPKV